jgi:hypothetical protein
MDGNYRESKREEINELLTDLLSEIDTRRMHTDDLQKLVDKINELYDFYYKLVGWSRNVAECKKELMEKQTESKE